MEIPQSHLDKNALPPKLGVLWHEPSRPLVLTLKTFVYLSPRIKAILKAKRAVIRGNSAASFGETIPFFVCLGKNPEDHRHLSLELCHLAQISE